MRASVAEFIMEGFTPYSQSFKHDEPQKGRENPDAYDERTWRFKLHRGEHEGRPCVVIPRHGLHQALVAGAKYSGLKVRGRLTYTPKFLSGIAVLEDPRVLDTDPDAVPMESIYANADGVRGSNKRVTRRFPVIHQWRARAVVHVLDDEITEKAFTAIAEKTGLFIGIGRFRPEKGGNYGRFTVQEMQWKDNRPLVVS